MLLHNLIDGDFKEPETRNKLMTMIKYEFNQHYGPEEMSMSRSLFETHLSFRTAQEILLEFNLKENEQPLFEKFNSS